MIEPRWGGHSFQTQHATIDENDCVNWSNGVGSRQTKREKKSTHNPPGPAVAAFATPRKTMSETLFIN
jgi:hypothetical protein